VSRLVRAELLKIRTTNTWWLFGIGAIVMTGLALLVNGVQAHYFLKETFQAPENARPEQVEQARAQFEAQHQVVTQAANIFTSGQFFGVLFVMLLGILVITNEYYHQTATTTFLTTPHRTTVVVGKLLTAMIAAAFFWLMSTVINLVVGSIFFRVQGFDSHLGDWPVTRAILLNLLAYAIWAVVGVGFGALIRSQLGATITGTLLYLIGTQLAQVVFFLLYTYVIKKDWVLTAMVSVPAVASQIMLSPVKSYPQSPPQWVGAAVLIGYALVAGGVGTLILRRRDVS
jgi:ABC-2 type transport system permease protein